MHSARDVIVQMGYYKLLLYVSSHSTHFAPVPLKPRKHWGWKWVRFAKQNTKWPMIEENAKTIFPLFKLVMFVKSYSGEFIQDDY